MFAQLARAEALAERNSAGGAAPECVPARAARAARAHPLTAAHTQHTHERDAALTPRVSCFVFVCAYSDPTAGFTVGAPFWQPLPDTQRGGAWLVPLTGPSGHPVTAPVAPAVPRVRKGLPPGATLTLTPAEVRDVILEYKCVGWPRRGCGACVAVRVR